MACVNIDRDKMFHNSVNAIVDLGNKLLYANVLSLADISICSHLKYVSYETSSHLTINQIAGDVSSFSVSDQIKEEVGLQRKIGMTMLMELTRRSAKFNASKKTSLRESQRGMSIEIVCDVAKHPGRYQCDESFTSCSFSASKSHEEDSILSGRCLLSLKSPPKFCKTFALPSQINNVDPNLSMAVQQRANQKLTVV